MMSIRQILLASLGCLVTAVVARAQCAPTWVPNPFGFGCDGEVYCAVEWDPDGAGPAPVELVVGGVFLEACGTPARNLARVDLSSLTATAFGTGANGMVQSLAVGSAGELIVGGAFTQIDGISAAGIANFHGGAWNAYGSGVDVTSGGPRALLPQPGGALVVGGRLASAGSVPVSSVARWDGVAWSAMGLGLRPADNMQPIFQEQGGVSTLVSSPNGVIAVGLFDASGTQSMSGVAEWNGVSWSQLGPAFLPALGLPTSGARAANGDLYVCGVVIAAVSSFVARWDGSTWTMLPPSTGSVRRLTATPNGEISVAGFYNFSDVIIERWNGTSWSVRGSTSSPFTAVRPFVVAATPSRGPDAIVLGGRQIAQVSGVSARSLLLHSTAGWIGDSQVFGGSNPQLYTGPGGDTLTTGGLSYGATALLGIGWWNGSRFVPFPQSPTGVTALAFDHRGGFVVAITNVIRRWDGGAWTTLGDPGIGMVTKLAVLPSNVVVAVNEFSSGYGRFWQGGIWQDFFAAPRHMALHPDGRLIVTGLIGAVGVIGRVGAWDGATWTDLDPATQIDIPPVAVVAMPNGDIVVGGAFTFGSRVARYDGVAWQPMGAGFDGNVAQLVVLADGRLVARGAFTSSGATPCPGTAIWNGSAWQAIPGAPTGILTLAAHPNGDLWAIVGRRIVRLATPCPAVVTSQPTACTNRAAAGYLEAPRWPMVDSVFQSLVSGLPASSLAAVAIGLPTPPLPLTSLFPPASPGCDIRVSADLVVYAPTNAGSARFDISVPNAPSLVGLTIVEQGAGITGLGSGILGATTTNSLALTIGSRQ